MNGEHPVPRFEIVHHADFEVVTVRPGPPKTTVRSTQPNPQPWSVRFIGANGEEVWRTSESYADVRDAERAISLLAEALGSQALFEGVKAVKDGPRPAAIAIVRVEVEP